MCPLLSPCLYRYAHTHTHIHSLYFSLPPISVSNIIHSHGKKANCILQQKSRKECSLPSALALIAQVELGLNEYRAGQPRVCIGPFLPQQSWKQRHLCEGQSQHQQPHDKQGLESLALLSLLPSFLQVGKDAHTSCKQVGEATTDTGGCKNQAASEGEILVQILP